MLPILTQPKSSYHCPAGPTLPHLSGLLPDTLPLLSRLFSPWLPYTCIDHVMHTPAPGPLHLLLSQPGKDLSPVTCQAPSLTSLGFCSNLVFLGRTSQPSVWSSSVLFSLLTLPDLFYSTYLHLAWDRSVFVVCLLLLMSAPSGRALFCSLLFTQRLEQCPAQNFVFNEKSTGAS